MDVYRYGDISDDMFFSKTLREWSIRSLSTKIYYDRYGTSPSYYSEWRSRSEQRKYIPIRVTCEKSMILTECRDYDSL